MEAQQCLHKGKKELFCFLRKNHENMEMTLANNLILDSLSICISKDHAVLVEDVKIGVLKIKNEIIIQVLILHLHWQNKIRKRNKTQQNTFYTLLQNE